MVAWSSFISHVVYGVVAIGTTGLHYDAFSPAHVSIGILALRSIVGVVNAITEEGDDNVKKVYDVVDKIAWFFAFPLYVTHLWLVYEMPPQYAYIHPLLALIPFGLYLGDKDYEDVSTAVMLLNALSAGYVTTMMENWPGLGATLVFAMTHGVIKWDMNVNDNITKEEVFNYLLAVFVMLAFWAW